jgi:hypothetical protein
VEWSVLPRGAALAGAGLVLWWSGTPLVAHDLARSESRLTVQGASVECQLTVDLLGFPGVDEDGNGAISYPELDRSIASVFARVKEHFVLRSPAEPSKILMTGHELLDEHTARLTLDYTFPSGLSQLAVTATFDRLTRRPDHQHFVIATIGGVEQRAVLDAGHSTVTFERGWWTRTSLWLTLAAVAIIGLRAAWFFRARKPPLLR